MSSITGQPFDGVYFTKYTKINPNVLGNHPFSWTTLLLLSSVKFSKNIFGGG